ncbi:MULTISPECIES: helix-turn-helix domain-containing protein [unclassified Frankia]|uniref:PucR family transcriptional regulator n=1 Tax=unclassified Frankia TaxID=2632575 RepID=UPI001EF5916D|nr:MULTISPECIES: helix-turn-helix domain-containing protein [unclassified Frankia]
MQTVPGGQFPSDLADILRLELVTLSDDLIAAIAREVPAYARPLEGSFGRGVHQGVEEALMRFLTVVGTHSCGPPDLATSREVYVRLGRGEFRAGRSLDTLLGAYRVGARVAWRRLANAAQHSGLDADGLVSLAETMFAYIDGISGATAEGYALAQSQAASERGRLWDRLGELMLSGGSPVTIEHTARAASYRLPDILAAVIVPGPANADTNADTSADGQEERVNHRVGCLALPPDAPRAIKGDDIWMFIGDPAGPGRRRWLERALAGLGAIVGPAVPWPEASASAARAAFARGVRDRGALPGAPDGPGEPLFTDDHLAQLLLAQDPALLADLTSRRLAPLDGLPAKVRARLAETLLLWLRLRGQRGRIAAELQVHPQTIRYRLNQLRALFGDGLDDPDVRFELELVLRADPCRSP